MRPTKLTPQIQQKIVTAIATGNTRKTAAAYAGIGVATLEDWLARGKGTSPRRSTSDYVEFVEAIEKAEADAVATSVALIRQAAQRNWQAAAWWLERRYSDEWGRKDAQVKATATIEKEIDEGAPARVIFTLELGTDGGGEDE